MAILPGITGLLDPTATDPTSAYGNPNVGSGGLLGGALNNPLFNFGIGLLSTVGKSTDPGAVSGVGNIGKAFGYASQAQEKSLQNELRRQAILQQRQELEAGGKIQELLKGDPTIVNDPARMLTALATVAPKEAISGLVGIYADPLRALKEQMTTDQATAAAASTADTKIKNNAQWQNSYAAASAADYLSTQKGGELLARSPLMTEALRSGKSVMEFFGGTPDAVIAQLPFLKGVDPKEIPKMLTAAQTLATRGTLLQPLTGDLSGAGLDVQRDAYLQVQRGAEDVAAADKRLKLPEPPKFAWGAAPATAAATPPPPATALAPPPTTMTGQGFQNGRIVPQPATQYTDLPPAPPPAAAPPAAPSLGDRLGSTIGNAYNKGWNTIFGSPAQAAPAAPLTPPVPTPAPAAAPAARKVGTVRYDPQGRALFRSEAEVHRAINNKWIALPPPGQTTWIVIGNQLRPLTNTGEPSGG